MLFSVELPEASTTRRLDRPWVYSWYRMLASFAPLLGTKASWVSSAPGVCHRYICMVGDRPSGGVFMLALSRWFPSGPPLASVAAPSRAFRLTGSPPLVSKLPAAGVKPIGFFCSQSWKLLGR